MINTQRIVPIQKVDFLTLIGTVMTLANVSYSVLASSDIDGDFTVTGSGSVGNLLANQPVESINFADGVTGATVYFVASYDYTGMSINGTAVTPTGTVNPDGITLYKAVLASGAVTITAVSPIAAS